MTTKLLCTGTLQTSLKEMLTVEGNMLYRKLKRKMKSTGATLETLKGQMIGIYFILFVLCFFLLPPWVRFSDKVPYQAAFEMTHIWLGQ